MSEQEIEISELKDITTLPDCELDRSYVASFTCELTGVEINVYSISVVKIKFTDGSYRSSVVRWETEHEQMVVPVGNPHYFTTAYVLTEKGPIKIQRNGV